jgi:hypothetical protein
MATLTLVLPFALPATEFAPDLARTLQAPALAALLSRTASHRRTSANQSVRALPHETWLAHALGLESAGKPAFAAAAMRGCGHAADAGTWFIVHPAHVDVASSHLSLTDPRHLNLSDEHARALFEAAKPSFDEAGYAFDYGNADTWFMRADDWAGLDTASPDAAVGMNLTDWMPTGARAIAFRKLQNEVQMLWHGHAVNAERESRGLAAVNALWAWSGTTVAAAQAAVHAERAQSHGAPIVAAFEAPGWMEALATRKLANLADIANGATEDTLLVCGNVAAPAIAADWSSWLHQMQRLETELFAPLHSALVKGRVARIHLVLSNRDALTEFTTTALAQRKFWRRPILERLI